MTGMAGDNEHPVSPSAGISQAIFSREGANKFLI